MTTHATECTGSELQGLEAMLAREGYRLTVIVPGQTLQPGQYSKRSFVGSEDMERKPLRWEVIWVEPAKAETALP